MVASPSELSLDCKQPQSYSMLLKSIALDNNISSSCGSAHQPPFIADHLQSQKLEEYLSRLEEERLKIDAFKRELPLCMQLLTNAMEASRQQLESYKVTNGTQGKRPILEEFIPIKHTNSEGSSDQQKPPNSTNDKANWMTSAQLWSQANEGATTKQSASIKESEMGLNPNLSLLDINDNKNNQRDIGGAFLPFTKERSSNSINHILPDLALTSDDKEADDNKCFRNEGGFGSENSALNGKMMDTTQTNVTGSTTASQTNRKQRRCWSPDLHRRFVNALQMLGGSQVATPKQIRELMKVDGLTNDEVKSHLQKYRLHTRRPGPNPQPAGAPGPQLVVLGGIWVPPEYSTAASGGAHHHMGQPHTIYSAHPAQHYFPPAIPQAEFYPPPLSQALPHPNHQIHIYKASPQRRSSPESDGDRGARDRSESIEDEKSESSSWKGDSGEESNGEKKRKKLACMREGEEESNGSDITLKSQVLAS